MIRRYLKYSLFAVMVLIAPARAQEAPAPAPTPDVSASPELDESAAEGREQVEAEMNAEDKPITESGAPAPSALADAVEAEFQDENADPGEPARGDAQADAALDAVNNVEGAVEDVDVTSDPLPSRSEDDPGLGLDDGELLPMDTSDIPDPDSLFPDDLFPGELPPPPPTVSENTVERDRKLRVRFQEVKFQALKDQAIREMKLRADRARTDEDKRAALREHYKMLFAKMVMIDPELAERCALMEQAYLRRLTQFRVEPTIPLNPPPTPEPLEAAPPES